MGSIWVPLRIPLRVHRFWGSEQKQRSCALGLGVLEAWVQGLGRFRVLGFRVEDAGFRV